jgi:Ca2+-binding RTX toxin-like protein
VALDASPHVSISQLSIHGVAAPSGAWLELPGQGGGGAGSAHPGAAALEGRSGSPETRRGSAGRTSGGGGVALIVVDHLSALQFENVIGSGVADTITGNRLTNNLSDNSGEDRVDVGFGNDIIAGGAGNDTLFGGGDNDFFLFGELGVANKDIIIIFRH